MILTSVLFANLDNKPDSRTRSVICPKYQITGKSNEQYLLALKSMDKIHTELKTPCMDQITKKILTFNSLKNE